MIQRKLQAGAAVAIAIGAAAGGSAAADTGRRADLDLAFTTTQPGTPSGIDFRILYKDASDPNGKPQPLREVIVAMPEGTRFDGTAVPACTASDDDLRTKGRAACPPSTVVGSGTLSAITGFGPPADPVTGDVTVYNGGDQVIEVVTQQGSDAPLGFDRLHFEGSRLHAHPAPIPGGPPDGQSSIREVKVRIAPHGDFVTTPPTCPAGGIWRASGTFGFADGVSETVAAPIACAGAATATTRRRARLAVTPRRVRSGATERFVVRLTGATGRCRRGVTIRLAGRHARTRADGTATLRARLERRGVHRVRAGKAGCPRVIALVRVR